MLAGFGLLIASQFLPVYIVPFDQAMRAFAAQCVDGRVNDAAQKYYLELFSGRYPLSNVGANLLAAGATALLGAYGLRLVAGSDLILFRTPPRRWMFVALGVLAIGSMLPGTIFGLGLDSMRRKFPTCADSVGIPIAGISISVMIITPILAAIGGAVALAFGKLPAPLGAWDRSRPLRSSAITAVFAVLTAFAIFVALTGMPSADVTGPMWVLIFYLLLATRAALVVPRL